MNPIRGIESEISIYIAVQPMFRNPIRGIESQYREAVKYMHFLKRTQ